MEALLARALFHGALPQDRQLSRPAGVGDVGPAQGPAGPGGAREPRLSGAGIVARFGALSAMPCYPDFLPWRSRLRSAPIYPKTSCQRTIPCKTTPRLSPAD